MGKVHVAAAVTLDGFLPDKKEKELWEWMRTSKRGFPYCQEKVTSLMFPNYPLLSLMASLYYSSNIYYAEVTDVEMVELLRRLSYFNLIDEITLYIFPISYKQGISLYNDFQQCDWELCGVRTFRNGICRMVYRRRGHHRP